MAKEIERKFLVRDSSFRDLAVKAVRILQGYLFDTARGVLRVRIKGEKAFLTLKSANRGITRNEWEDEIPVADARQMLELAGNAVLEKTRFIVPFEGKVWEVDVFEGKLAGLVLGEVELPSEITEVVLPPFVGEEVSTNPMYYNSALAASVSV